MGTKHSKYSRRQYSWQFGMSIALNISQCHPRCTYHTHIHHPHTPPHTPTPPSPPPTHRTHTHPHTPTHPPTPTHTPPPPPPPTHTHSLPAKPACTQILIPSTRPRLQTPSELPFPHPVVAMKDNFVDGQEPLKYRAYRDHVVYHGTDRCQTANGREVYSYLEPDIAENARLRQAFEPSLCLPDVAKLGFPKNVHASYRAWYSPGGSSATLIYSSQVWGLLPKHW